MFGDGLVQRGRLKIGLTDQQSNRSHLERVLIRASLINLRLHDFCQCQQFSRVVIWGHHLWRTLI